MILKKIIYLLLLCISVFSYELPSINISENNTKPEIIFFTAESIVVGEKQSFELKWKTINATKVTMTYLGQMDLSGSIIVTTEEFNKGAVTLKAFSDKSKHIDELTLNSNENMFDETQKVPKNMSNETPQFYDTIPRTYGRPYRRHPGTYPRRRY